MARQLPVPASTGVGLVVGQAALASPPTPMSHPLVTSGPVPAWWAGWEWDCPQPAPLLALAPNQQPRDAPGPSDADGRHRQAGECQAAAPGMHAPGSLRRGAEDPQRRTADGALDDALPLRRRRGGGRRARTHLLPPRAHSHRRTHTVTVCVPLA